MRVVTAALQRVAQRATVAAAGVAAALGLARSDASEDLWRAVPTSSAADEAFFALVVAAPLAGLASLLQRVPTLRRVGRRLIARDEPAPTAAEVRAQQVQRLLKASEALEMHFQPIVDLRDGAVTGYEALARFRTDEDIPPNVWFAEAAAVGMGIELELFAIRHVLARLKDLPDGPYVAVNVSPAAVVSAEFQSCLQGSPADRIVVELTEHAEVTDYDRLSKAIEVARATGVRVAVDDAGAGFASFRHILRLGPDIIKLDRDLVAGLQEDSARRALCGSLVQFANEVGATFVAEGIEERDELDALIAAGVCHGQGYLLGRPEPRLAAA